MVVLFSEGGYRSLRDVFKGASYEIFGELQNGTFSATGPPQESESQRFSLCHPRPPTIIVIIVTVNFLVKSPKSLSLLFGFL